jgi:multiple sugar transport system substrate-binding protein
MKSSRLSRRSFLKLSSSALAAALLSPNLSRIRAQDATDMRVSMWDGIEVQPIEEEVLQGFTEQFGKTVSIEFNPDTYDDKLLTGLAAGNAPDVFLWWNFPKLVARNGLEDLTPYTTGSSPLDTSIYYQEILNMNRVGEGLYGLPKDFTPRAYFFNKKMFDDAGIDYPTADWTWNDLQEMAIALTSGEGVDKAYGFYNYTGIYPLQPYVWSNGGDFISPDGMTATGYLDSDATIQALEWYIQMQTELGVSPTATQEKTIGSATELFINNKLAIYDTGIWPQSQFFNTPDLEFGTVLPPKSPNTDTLITVLHAAGWSMNPASADKDMSWELLKWMSSPRAAQIRAEAGWGLPALPSIAEQVTVESSGLNFIEDPIYKTWFEGIPFATVTPLFFRNPNWDKAEEEIGLAVQAAFLGEMPIADGLRAAAPIVDGILQQEA